MCGLVGVIGNITVKEEKVFRTLLIFDSVRGEHSTGIAAVDANKDLSVAKCVGDPYQLLDTRESEAIFRKANRVLIGHNRYATTGKITRRNAHPFEFSKIVGAHNGTLTNKYSLPKNEKFDVDSEALFNCINEEGVVSAIGRTRGAWALTWYEKDTTTMHFLRNKERTLFACYNEAGDCLFWASEMWMLQAALSRNEIKYQKIFYFAEDIHYEIEMDFAKKTLSGLTQEDCKGAPEVVYDASKKALGISTRSYGAIGTAISPDDKYLGTTNTYEIISLSKDENGAEFLYIRDESQPTYMTRLYLHKQDHLKDKNGYKFKGKVVGIKKGVVAFFYKVVLEGVLYKEKALPAIIIQPTDKQGNVVTEKDHFFHYHTCAWCNSPVEYCEKDIVYVDKTTGVICSSCKTDPTVVSFL